VPGAVEAAALMRADNRRLGRDLSVTQRKFRRTFSKISRGIKGSLRGALSPLGVGAGAIGIAAIGREVLDFEETLTRLQIQARKGDAPEFLANLRNETIALSKATGKSRQQIAFGTKALVDFLGITDTTSERVAVMARASTATGASMEDLAGIAFKLDTAFGITSGADLEAALDALTFAGQETSIPLEKMGQLLAKTAPVFTKFGKSGVNAAADLGAFLQITQKFGTAATPEEVATQFSSFVRALEKNRTRIKRLGGFDIFTKGPGGVKRLKDIRTIFDELSRSELAKDPELFIKAFGRGEAADFATAIFKNREAFESLASASTKAGGTIKRDFKTFMESPSGRIQVSFNNAKEALAKAFTPERIEKFAEAMEMAADAVAFAVDHAEVFIGLWATFKVAGIVNEFLPLAPLLGRLAVSSASTLRNFTQMGPQLGQINTTMKGIGASAGIVGAALIGWEVGKMLDDWLGISDAIANIQEKTQKARQDVAGVEFEGAPGTLAFGAGIAGGGFEERTGRRAQRVLTSAREQGLITPQGRALDVSQIEERLDIDDPLERRIRAAIISKSITTAQQVQRIEVDVRVDAQGIIRARETEESQAQRGPQP
jgi:TP901 family phage tail tape measure protein